MFIGEYFHTIDEKGRIAIPTKFRSKLTEGIVITRGLDNCLFLYTLEEWKNLANKLSKLSISKANTRAFSRLMLAGAMDLQLDKQGRIIIPDYLRKYASIKKKAVIAGLFNRLEIWDQDIWEKYKNNTEKTSENIAEALEEL
ncbi:MAG: division/cell wall cluster transcriptional repressor MraZ [Candidatus Kuenenbacteria bacterium]